jgi:hypothetical protein
MMDLLEECKRLLARARAEIPETEAVANATRDFLAHKRLSVLREFVQRAGRTVDAAEGNREMGTRAARDSDAIGRSLQDVIEFGRDLLGEESGAPL